MAQALIDAILQPPPQVEWDEFARQHIQPLQYLTWTRWLTLTGDAQFLQLVRFNCDTNECTQFLKFVARHMDVKTERMLTQLLPADRDKREESVRVLSGCPRFRQGFFEVPSFELYADALQFMWALCQRRMSSDTEETAYVTEALNRLFYSYRSMYDEEESHDWEDLVCAYLESLVSIPYFASWLEGRIDQARPKHLAMLLDRIEKIWDTDTGRLWAFSVQPRTWMVIVDSVLAVCMARQAAEDQTNIEALLVRVPRVYAHMMQTVSSPSRSASADVEFWTFNEIVLPDASSHVGQLILEHRLRRTCLDVLRSDMYVRSLSSEDAELLTLWTHACSLLQERTEAPPAEERAKVKKFQPVDTPQRRWLVQRLAYLFAHAPSSHQELTVFRGITVACDAMRLQSRNPMAVSYAQDVAKQFVGNDGCMICMVLEPGTRFLCVDTVSVFKGKERELLLPQHALLEIAKQKESSQDAENPVSIHTFSVRWPTDFTTDAQEPVRPAYVKRPISTRELLFLLKKGKFKGSVSEVIELFNRPEQSYAHDATELFRIARSWQLAQCGFGPVQDAIDVFCDALFHASLRSDAHKQYVEALRKTWARMPGLLFTPNTLLDKMQEFARPLFAREAAIRAHRHDRSSKRKHQAEEVEAKETDDKRGRKK
jgi:hypothetical protein